MLRLELLDLQQTQTMILSRITHAISVWIGHLTNQQRQRINALLKRARKFGFTETIYCVKDLLEKSDTRLFTCLKNPTHCLYPILPHNNKSCQLLLRKRWHTFTLPHCTYNWYENFFVPHCLFKFDMVLPAFEYR